MTPEQRALARWILAQESSESGAAGVPESAVRPWEKLRPRLEHIFTPQGCYALGKRAVFLSCDDFPFLKSTEGAMPLEELAPALEGAGPDRAAAAAEAVYANLIGLLLGFIGEGLALRIIQDVWPAAPLLGRGERGQENEV